MGMPMHCKEKLLVDTVKTTLEPVSISVVFAIGVGAAPNSVPLVMHETAGGESIYMMILMILILILF